MNVVNTSELTRALDCTDFKFLSHVPTFSSGERTAVSALPWSTAPYMDASWSIAQAASAHRSPSMAAETMPPA